MCSDSTLRMFLIKELLFFLIILLFKTGERSSLSNAGHFVPVSWIHISENDDFCSSRLENSADLDVTTNQTVIITVTDLTGILWTFCRKLDNGAGM